MGQAENNNHVEGRAFVYNILLFFKATVHIWGILGEKNLNQNNHMFQANPPHETLPYDSCFQHNILAMFVE